MAEGVLIIDGVVTKVDYPGAGLDAQHLQKHERKKKKKQKKWLKKGWGLLGTDPNCIKRRAAKWLSNRKKKARREKRVRERQEKRSTPQRTERKSRFSERYLAYIRSPQWRQKREKSFQVHGRVCNRCPSKHRLQCHHLTYKRLGDERVETDIEILCFDCHNEEHGHTMSPPI